jgi:hypothetical protein
LNFGAIGPGGGGGATTEGNDAAVVAVDDVVVALTADVVAGVVVVVVDALLDRGLDDNATAGVGITSMNAVDGGGGDADVVDRRCISISSRSRVALGRAATRVSAVPCIRAPTIPS